MKHVEYWIADDGTQFDDEIDCKRYELKQRLSQTTLQVINSETGIAYEGQSIITQKTYNECEAVIVKDDKALSDMKAIQDFTGFYYEIDSIGKWRYDDDECKWIKEVVA